MSNVDDPDIFGEADIKRIDCIDGADFLAEELPQPEWIVEGFIARRMKGDLVGGAKSRKTFLALSLALCAAAGRDWLDAYKIPKPHPTAYLNFELMP